MLIWVLSFGELIVKLISQIFNDEPYYAYNALQYFLAFALAPFVLNSYMDGMNLDGEMKQQRKLRQKVNFLLLSAFAMMLLFLSIASYYAFRDTFFDEELSVRFLFLMIPISFIVMSVLLIRFLYRSSIQK
jgi:arginine exporter protein ArgO